MLMGTKDIFIPREFVLLRIEGKNEQISNFILRFLHSKY